MDKATLKATASAIAEINKSLSSQILEIKSLMPVVEVRSQDLEQLKSTILSSTLSQCEEIRADILSLKTEATAGLQDVYDQLIEAIDNQDKQAQDKLAELEKQIHSIDIINKRIDELTELLETTAEDFFAEKRLPGPQGAGIDVAYWQAGIYRSATVVQHYLGQYFIAQKDTADEPGQSDDWKRLGSAGFRHTGGFDAEKMYSVGDLFSKDFGTFLVKGQDDVVLLSARGAKGNASTVPGPQGPAGPHVAKIHTDEQGMVFEMSDGAMVPASFDGLVTSKALFDAVENANDFASLKRSLLSLARGVS